MQPSRDEVHLFGPRYTDFALTKSIAAVMNGKSSFVSTVPVVMADAGAASASASAAAASATIPFLVLLNLCPFVVPHSLTVRVFAGGRSHGGWQRFKKVG